MFLIQMPATWTYHQHSSLLVQLVDFALWTGIGNRTSDGIAHIDLPLDSTFPGRCMCIFKVCHEDLRPRIERVNDHFAVNRTSDLDTAVLKVSRQGSNRPISLTNIL